jgi:LuxR family maltose regulon positive regulatory protein
MEILPQAHDENRVFPYFERLRLNQLFTEAIKYPIVVVCAGAGYGKTTALHNFIEGYQSNLSWIQLSERDNVVPRFWEKILHNWADHDPQMASEIKKLGFPDSKEKINRYKAMVYDRVEVKSRIIVFDDFHCIEEPQVINYIENTVFSFILPGTTMFIVSRTMPRNINIANLTSQGQLFNISESDLQFTENELAQYFRFMDISVQADNIREIMRDTEGWAFAINLIARSYQRAPGYGGYVRNAMKTNIFQLMETEIWNEISGRLQNFLVRLSLIDHLSFDLLTQLIGGDEELLAEFEGLNAYVRRDCYINAYLIHPLFLEFLSTKQESLSEEQKRETYAVAGDWCTQNGFKIDAISYYEKTGNYQLIVSILDTLPAQLPHDIAQYAAVILDRAPQEAFDKVEFLAEIHLRTRIGQGLWQKSLDLVKHYEAKFLKLPDGSSVKNRILARIYTCWAYIRGLMSLTDDIFDFDIYTKKACKYITTSDNLSNFSPYCTGAWINSAGSSRKGGPEEYIAAVTRNQEHLLQSNIKGFMAGEPELAQGELEFYQGNTSSAVSHVDIALKQARTSKQFELIHRALFYSLRIAVTQGNFAQAEQVMKDTKALLDETEYINRFINYDLSLSWYYCFLGLPEKTADWLKDDFSQYFHAAFIENYGNQIKARYCYTARNYPPLQSYIEEMKKRESFLFGRLEMLVMEACIYYKMKNKKKAFNAFEEAYKTASPNEIIMPFIEMGKDMRTLTAALLKESGKVIPKLWLEDINHKSATYAKRRSHIIAKYMQTSGIMNNIVMSPREAEVLADISHGLSRGEIAASRKLSTNTVKMVINNIRFKLGAENIADLIRIAVEKKLI